MAIDNNYNLDTTDLQGFTISDGNAIVNFFDSDSYLGIAINLTLTIPKNYVVTQQPEIVVTVSNNGYNRVMRFNPVVTDNNYKFSDNGEYTPTVLYNNAVFVSAVLSGVAIYSTPTVYADYPLIRLYKVDNQIMQSVSTERFDRITIDGNTEIKDLTSFILQYTRYPFNIATSQNANVIIGYKQTNISAPLIDKQVFTLSLGKVLIAGLYDNTSDIDTSEIYINIAFYGLVNIPSKYINTEIEIVYNIDIVGNNCVVNILSNDTIINSVAFSIGYNIPYIINTKDLDYKITTPLNNNVLKNFESQVIIRQHPKIAGFDNNTRANVLLSTVKGFVKCLDYHIKNVGTSTETEMIETALNNGVYFNA